MRLADLPEAPDAAAAIVLPQLAAVVASFPPAERLARVQATLIFLARENGLAGGWAAAIAATEAEALAWCLRVLLHLAPTTAAAAALFHAATASAARSTDFPEPSPARPRSPPPRPPAPDATPPVDVLRAVSVAAAEAAVSAAAPTHRAVEIDALGVVYVVPRAATVAPSVLAAAHRLARAPAPSAVEIATLPPATVAAIAAIPSAPDRQLLFAEELTVKGLPDSARVLLALRACRQPGAPLEPEELSAWLAGSFPLLWAGDVAVSCPRGGGGNNNKNNNRSANNNNNNNSKNPKN